MREETLKALRKLRTVANQYRANPEEEPEGFSSFMGICHSLGSVTGLTMPPELEELWKKWPKYSGDADYPVPSVLKNQIAKRAFYFSSDCWRGPYGDLHLELLQFMITKLSE